MRLIASEGLRRSDPDAKNVRVFDTLQRPCRSQPPGKWGIRVIEERRPVRGGVVIPNANKVFCIQPKTGQFGDRELYLAKS
jgi:hypothetical protein